MNEAADPMLAPSVRTFERTVVLGYLVGATLAWLTFMVSSMAWRALFISRYDLGFWAGIATVALPIAWIFLVPPFALVRWVSGTRAFSVARNAGLMGGVIGILSIPLMVEMTRIFNIEGPERSFVSDLALTFAELPLFAGAGAIGGIVYWLVEFSSFPTALIRLFGDPKSLTCMAGFLSRRVAAGMVIAIAVATAVPVAKWWWRPHVYQAAEAQIPSISFEQEWQTKGWIGSLTWSADSMSVISLSDGHSASLNNRELQSGVSNERTLPLLDPLRALENSKFVIAPERFHTRNAFEVFSAETGELLHEQPAQAPPGNGGSPRPAQQLALSPDGSILAVGYKTGVPISLFSTRDWQVISTLSPEFDQLLGVTAIAFSNDGQRLAVGGVRELLICDVKNGAVLNRIPGWTHAVAFSPDSTMVAVAEHPVSSVSSMHIQVHVVRLSDGVEIASRAPISGSGASVLWDPRGRFIVFAVMGDYSVHLWNPTAPSMRDVTIDLRRFERGLGLSSDGSHLAVGNGGVVSIFKIAG